VLVLLVVGTGWDLHRAARIRHLPRVPDSTSVGVANPVDTSASPPDSHRVATGGERRPVVDLNRATLVELDALPGIGPVLARRIVEHRGRHGPFRSVDELRAVAGIGPALLERLRGLVHAAPPADDRGAVRAERNPARSGPEPLFPSR
jgi:comEA protein